jgi:hypothetical protein
VVETGVDKLNEGTRVVASFSGGQQTGGRSGAMAGAKVAGSKKAGGKRQ